MRSTTIFSNKVSKTDFEDWNNNLEKKFLFVGFENGEETVKFYTPEKALAKIQSENDYSVMKRDFEDDEAELLNYYGFYLGPDDFYRATNEEEFGEFQFTPIDDKTGILSVSLYC